jgi:hypothetical protein
VNDKGEPMRIEARITPEPSGFAFRVSLPYSVAKGQKVWTNGIEYGGYSIQEGEVMRNFIIASHEAEVKIMLQRELAGGLRTWEAVFDRYGYIPTGIGCHSTLPGVTWDKFSDSGGYAHLLSAAAQWLMYLEKKNDWNEWHTPREVGLRTGK